MMCTAKCACTHHLHAHHHLHTTICKTQTIKIDVYCKSLYTSSAHTTICKMRTIEIDVYCKSALQRQTDLFNEDGVLIRQPAVGVQEAVQTQGFKLIQMCDNLQDVCRICM